MRNRNFIILLIISLFLLGVFGFTSKPKVYKPVSIIKPINVNKEGFELLDNIQGQWIGINSVAGINYDWFVFDYRAINTSHIHGIYEGGSMGNLFTSFFIANFKGKNTIMARNGGV